MDTIIGILLLLVLGLIVGALAKFIMPGDDPGGILVTSILGIAGAILGGWIARFLEIGGITGLDWRSLVTAVGGSLVLLFAYRAFRMLAPRSTAPSTLAGRTNGASPLRSYPVHSDTDATDSVTELIDTAKGAFSANVVQKLSGMLGESTGATRKAVEAMVPTILAGMSSKASTNAVSSQLYDMAKDAALSGNDLVGRLDSHLNETGLDALTHKGGTILSTLFGDKLNGLLSWFTRFAGVKESSATSLMGLAANFVLGMLGKSILQKGLTAATFGRTLSSLAEPLSRLLPSGITNVPGMNALADLGDRAATTTRATVETGQRVGASARVAYREAAGAVRKETSWLAAIAPLLLLAIPLLAFAYAMRGGAAKLINQPENVRVNVPQAIAPLVSAPTVRPSEIPAPVAQPALVQTSYVATDAQEQNPLSPALEQLRETVSERLQTVADQLGLTPEQRTKIEKAHATFADKFEALRTQRRELLQSEFAAVRDVLTPEQRDAVKELVEDLREAKKETGAKREWPEVGQIHDTLSDRLHAAAEKLALTPEQREKIRVIHAPFVEKYRSHRAERRDLVQAELKAVAEELTPEQREKAKHYIEGQMVHAPVVQSVAERLRAAAGKLGITEQQRTKIREIHTPFAEKFHDLADERRALLHSELKAISEQLTSDQRDRVQNFFEDHAVVVGIEIDPNDPDAIAQLRETVAERLRAVADKLGLTEEQRNKIREAHAAFVDKYETQRTKRRDLRQQELKAFGEVLTPEQRENVKGFIEDRVESVKNN